MPCDDDAARNLAGLGLAQAGTARWNRQEAWTKVRRDGGCLEAGEIQKAVAAVTHASLAPEGVVGVTDVIRRLLPMVGEASREAALLLARGAAVTYLRTGSDQPTQRWFYRQALAIASSHDDAGLELRVLAHLFGGPLRASLARRAREESSRAGAGRASRRASLGMSYAGCRAHTPW